MHFQSKLHNNSILTGSVDSYCLVCDNYLRSEDEAFIHSEKPIHKKNMGAATRVEKFLDDRIIKVKKGYYCPFCNILLSTSTKVSIHIGDLNHQENKGVQMLSRVADYVVAFDEVAITLESWHGLMEDTCVICNTECDDNKHRTNQGHILKLVQSKCEFGDKFVYRKVDEDSFFCLICASIFSINEKTYHHENTSHKNLYNAGKELKSRIPPQTIITAKTTPKPDTTIDAKNYKQKSTNNTDAKNTDVDTKKNHANEVVEDTPGPAIDPRPSNFKIKDLSKKDETMTLYKNMVHANNIAEKNQKKPENVTVAKEKSGKKSTNIPTYQHSTDDNSNILDRVDEFQKKGINIDFTWERARCKHCNEDVLFDTAAIDQHIEVKHSIRKKADAELKTDLEKQVKKSDINDVKIEDSLEPKTDKTDNAQLKQEKKNDVKIIEPKADTNKTFNAVKFNPDLQQQTEIKLDTRKDNNETKLDKKKPGKKSNNSVPKTINNSENGITKTKEQNSALNPTKDLKKALETFAKENDMVVMLNEAYCLLCKDKIPLNMAALSAHADSSSHLNKKPNQNEIFGKGVQTSICLQTFIRMESNLGSDIVLNNKYVLRHHSFHCIVIGWNGVEYSYKCMLCDVVGLRNTELLTQHINGPDHKGRMGMSKVVTSLPEEFIREISSDVYHCGYCNEVLDGWTEMKDHLSRSKHTHARRHAQWNLKRCHSVIRNTTLTQVSSMDAITYS